jgi:hypothetical protein
LKRHKNTLNWWTSGKNQFGKCFCDRERKVEAQNQKVHILARERCHKCGVSERKLAKRKRERVKEITGFM